MRVSTRTLIRKDNRVQALNIQAQCPSSCAFPSNHLLNALWLDQIREAERLVRGTRALGKDSSGGTEDLFAIMQTCNLANLIS